MKLRIGIIGGSGLGESLKDGIGAHLLDERRIDTPFGKPSSSILLAQLGDLEIALLKRHGDGHTHSPHTVPYRANVFALKALGCTHLIASGACGSLQEQIEPGSIAICDQLIDRTDGRPRTFFDQAAVHVEFAEPFCPVMRRWLLAAAGRVPEVCVHPRGTYLCMEGPSFSTRAESHLHRAWGADVVGMTALPEARLAREAEMAYALLALPTDYDCWRTQADDRPESLLREIIGNLNRAVAASIRLVRAALSDVALLRSTPSPAHNALELGIWSDKASIPSAEVDRLRPLWGRHFG